MPQTTDFLKIIHERGFFHQGTNMAGLEEAIKIPITAYIGFDCTAPSLHVGSLMQIMVLRWLQKCGHKPIILMGGATTRIGDPTFKDAERPALSDDVIAFNMQGIQQVFSKFITFGTKENDALMVNNADWMDRLGYLELLRDYGRHFSINRMLSMDSVKLRLERESEMSFLEFNYMIMQAYDFVTLYNTHDCRLQIGGSDQWGNIISGVELHRRLMAHKNEGQQNVYASLFGLTTPLITTASGGKMGKTANGAVWLNKEQLSAYDYWQFWRNTDDMDVKKFLLLFTELEVAEIEALTSQGGAAINEAKKRLANEATTLCHGAGAALEAAETARKTFEEGKVADNLATYFIDKSQLEQGIAAYALFHLAGLRESKGEARKLIEGGGAKLNDAKINDPKEVITLLHLVDNTYIKLSAGKKQHLLIKLK